jgi:hypothetical protein
LNEKKPEHVKERDRIEAEEREAAEIARRQKQLEKRRQDYEDK